MSLTELLKVEKKVASKAIEKVQLSVVKMVPSLAEMMVLLKGAY